MHTRFTSLVSGLTLSALLAGPVFAQTPVDTVNNDQALIQSCQQTNVPVYRSSLDEALLALRGSVIDQWKRQVGFRVNAARSTRRAAVQRALQQAGLQLDTAFDQFAAAQNGSLDKDVNVAVDTYIRLDDQAEDAALARWADRNVSFQALDAALTRAERSLRLYATARDRATLSRVWNSTRKQAEDAFAQSRDEARQQFVQDMDDCIAGVKTDSSSEEPASDQALSPEKKMDEKKSDDTSSKSMSFMVTSINLDTVSDYASTCAQKVMARANIYTNGVGRTSGYFLFHDGVRSPEIVADTDAMGRTYAQFQREFSSTSGSFTNGNVKYIITSPNAFESNRADFKIQCQGTTTPQPTNTPTSGDTKADARLLVDGKAEVNTCGAYRYTFTGTITYGAAGTVKYYWLRSDGSSSAPETVTFDGPGTKTVRTTWDLNATYAGWIRLMIISPNMTQSQADFNLIEACSTTTPPPAEKKSDADSSAADSSKVSAVVSVVSKQDASVCGAYRFQFQGNITTDNAGKIVYRWERSDGVLSPEQTIAAEKAGTYTASESWDLSGMSYAGWTRLHVLSPADTSSNQAAFTLTQACK